MSSYTHYSEPNFIGDLLHGKPQNYKLAYLVALKRAEGDSVDPAETFKSMLRALNEVDVKKP